VKPTSDKGFVGFRWRSNPTYASYFCALQSVLFQKELLVKVVLVCGPTGAGKTTYSLSLAKELGAVRFSIDAWMQTLFDKDMISLDYSWMIERVERCYRQIWEMSEQILALGGVVVLDLGFTTKAQRSMFVGLADSIGANSEIHCLSAPVDIRRARIKQRNIDKDPNLYSFEVTDFMFDFMEPKFEIPDESELHDGQEIINDGSVT
jgi:predicted kinase